MQKHFTLIPFLFTLLTLTLSQIQQVSVPQTFGFMTMTHARGLDNQDNSIFQKYLSLYAFMDCPLLTQINIVWNNEKTPQAMGVLKNSKNWKRPINFHITPHNSLDWRYTIPSQSKVQVYFSIDDDIIISCQELIKGFKVWQTNAVGQIGPIVAYEARYVDYVNGKGFNYGFQPTQFYNFGLIGYAFVSRHFMQLYYSNIWELSQMRKVVIQKNNCEDIGLEWLTEYFYPELKTIVIKGVIKNIATATGVSTAANHQPKRSECIRQFTQIFGVNVLKYRPTQEKYPDSSRWKFPLNNKTIIAKKKYFEKYLLHKTGLSTEGLDNLDQFFQSDDQKNRNQELVKRNQQTVGILQAELAESIQYSTNIELINKELNQEIQKVHYWLSQYRNIQQTQSSKQQIDLNPVYTESITAKQHISLLLLVEIAVVILLIVICVCQLRTKSREAQPDSLKMKYISVSVPKKYTKTLSNPNPQDYPRNMQ